MKMNKLGLIVLLGFLVIAQSCNNAIEEPNVANINMEMKASTALSSISSGRVAAEGLIFTEVLLGVTELEFETLEENEAEDNGVDEDGNEVEDVDGDGEDDTEEVEYEGEFVVDLLAGTSTPDFGASTIAPGLYEEIEIEMGPILEGGLTMFIAFDYISAGTTDTVKYEFSTSQEIEYELENEDGFLLDEGALNQMLVVFDLDAMFANIDLNTATADVDGVVRINEASNSQLYGVIFENFKNSMEGGEDDDDDGEIDG